MRSFGFVLMEVQTQNLTPSSYPFGNNLLDKTVVHLDDHENEGIINHSEKLISITTEMVKSMVIKKSEFKDGEDTTALMMQKAYKGYRTWRQLADSAVLAEEYWWQAIDYARSNHSTISFFNVPETPISRWNRVSLNASKVGKGATKDAKARKFAFQHWIEAIDPWYRYGHSLHLYYEEWCNGDAGQPFFYWMDIEDGKDVDLKECPRSKLQQQCIKYLGPICLFQERENYEYITNEGTIHHRLSGEPLDMSIGSEGAKWIFKKKGCFHHSSFLAGDMNGELKSIFAYSRHYRPTAENLNNFKYFLSENGVNLDEVQIRSSTDDYESNGDSKSVHGIAFEAFSDITKAVASFKSLQLEIPNEGPPKIERKVSYKRTLSGGLQHSKADVPKKKILERINSKKATSSYQLAGPRIGPVTDYPAELRRQAFQFVNLSPRTTAATSRQLAGFFPSFPCPNMIQ
ncbi:hypothetical protein MKW98_028859 [Papaver atlanticum]|uniref:IQ domain-containing protein IQM3-like n=1 Tax=Papaver atlanticum TaxID=357466 RepID=A0AAD4S382_9MAGN|nr:hypothetical protein MKW98_028859 [Papaver atlanticum]